jgi:hypothetical protein
MHILPLARVAIPANLLNLEEHQASNSSSKSEGFSCFSVFMIDISVLHPIYVFDSLSWVSSCISLGDAGVLCLMFPLVSRWALQCVLKSCKELTKYDI